MEGCKISLLIEDIIPFLSSPTRILSSINNLAKRSSKPSSLHHSIGPLMLPPASERRRETPYRRQSEGLQNSTITARQ